MPTRIVSMDELYELAPWDALRDGENSIMWSITGRDEIWSWPDEIDLEPRKE